MLADSSRYAYAIAATKNASLVSCIASQ